MEARVCSELISLLSTIFTDLWQILDSIHHIQTPTHENVRLIREILGAVNQNASTIISKIDALGWHRRIVYFYPAVNALEVLYISTEGETDVIFHPHFFLMVSVLIDTFPKTWELC